MRVAVMGSGGLGGYFGALLARGGTDVSFIARGEHLEAMRRDGLRIDGGPDPFHLEHVCATDNPAEIGPVDLVMVCVKLWDTEAAARQIAPLLARSGVVIPFQNGVENLLFLFVLRFGGRKQPRPLLAHPVAPPVYTKSGSNAGAGRPGKG